VNKCHSNLNFLNDTTPALNDTNMNYMDGCIDTIDDRVISLDTTKADQSDLLLAFKDVSLNSTTGVITFTLFNNTTKTIDTLLEKVAINFDYDDDPTSAHYQNLIIELEDGTYKYIDMSALITEYEFTNSSTVAFTVGADGSVSASVIDGSITGAKLQPNYLADVTAQANAASGSANTASAQALASEGFANGTQNGSPVGSGSPYYENNAKYWKDQAQAIASASLSGLSDVSISNPQDGQVLMYDATNHEWTNGTVSRIIAVPIAKTKTYTYDGTAQTFEWDLIDPDAVVLTNDTQTNAGTYTVTASLLFPSDVWADNTTSPKTYTWTINKANASLSVSVNSLSLSNTTSSANVTVTFTNDTGADITSTDSDVASPSEASLVSSATITITTSKKGNATVTAATSASVNYNAASATISISSTYVTLKTFAAATDAEIADMVEAADLGYIDLYDDAGWRVGQEHQISLSAITATGTYDGVTWSVGEVQNAQTATLVLMHRGSYELVTSVLNKQGQTRNTCSFICGLKNGLETEGYINSTNTNTGSWDSSARRLWCNGGFRSAIPSSLQSAFKQFKTITATSYNGSTNTTSNDYFALPAAKEIFGGTATTAGADTSYSNLTEFNALTQFDWYSSAANRSKNRGDSGAVTSWFERSPFYNGSTQFCVYYKAGNASYSNAGSTNAISPFGCL